MKEYTADGEEEGFEILKQETQKYLDMGYKKINVKTGVNEKGDTTVEIIPSELEKQEKQEDKKIRKLLGGENAHLDFKAEDIEDYQVVADKNMIAIYLKAGSVVRDRVSGKAMVIQDTDNQFVGKIYIPEHKSYLIKLDEEIADVIERKIKVSIGMKDAMLLETTG
jgi:hypothetical protein